MKIIVIGASASIRSDTVRRLRGQGHEAAAAMPLVRQIHGGTLTALPLDPGHAGRHLRRLLENTAAAVVGLRRSWRIPTGRMLAMRWFAGGNPGR